MKLKLTVNMVVLVSFSGIGAHIKKQNPPINVTRGFCKRSL